ncbi:hypothetical protein [Microbulbifer taiwanensis]|uniref:Uncharacterized protein n=1 Tax=Microbulbifer taiwanensis TaxID=986746 RepID=A0ABW1YGB9_9GAMM|nr:hypothetical protein [Microbulbifer taiwanensis]
MKNQKTYLLYWRENFIGLFHQRITDVGGIAGTWEPSDSSACVEFERVASKIAEKRLDWRSSPESFTRVILKKDEKSRIGHAIVCSYGKKTILDDPRELLLFRHITKSDIEWLKSNVE